MYTLQWLENTWDNTIQSKQEIIDYIATLFDEWYLQSDPEVLWLDSEDEWNYERWQDTYNKSMAVWYLESLYNTSSKYSPNEQLLYLAWVYSRIDK